ncbi:Crp/Fnr family transcriptional regulator [Oryzicola mucosus]|uniref:Crp/Fnr family transcriptional regulator n=1 Tax=Oryzicola mucosus TaxID=2767425 RepID=A0A8J6PSD1_9HYPH|nr:Crp/Fnr family transcriptional regulator [Oryzicola mucosus]MBD0417525.1 Crp/Fnr family transcriptional regulator [Oryzicola mucosus]
MRSNVKKLARMTAPLIARFRSKSVRDWRADITDAIAEHGTLRKFDRKDVIFHQGMPAKAVYAVKSGVIETSGLNASGREVTLSIRGPREPFGYSEAVLAEPRTRQASVLQDAEIWELGTDPFLDMLAERPDIMLAMLGSMMFRVTRSSEMRAELRGTSAYNRVGYVLLQLANSTTDLSAAAQPQLRITHEEISRVCDLSRQTVTTILGEMRDAGIVELGLRSIRLMKRARLDEQIERALGD